MNPISRRRVLSCAAGFAVGLSGCSGSNAEDTPTATATEPSYAQSATDPTARRLRNDDGDPAVRSSAVNPPTGWISARWAVGSERAVDALEFAPEATGIDAVTSFLDDTDFAEETALVHQYPVGPCRTRRLRRLRWGASANGPSGRYRVRLDYDVTDRGADCRSDAPDDVEATVGRIPVAVGRIGSFSSSW